MACQLICTDVGLLSSVAISTKKRSGPEVLLRPQIPYVFFVQAKPVLSQEHRERGEKRREKHNSRCCSGCNGGLFTE